MKGPKDNLRFGNEKDKSYVSFALMLERDHAIQAYPFTSWRIFSFVNTAP